MKIHLPTYPSGVHRIEELLSCQELELDPDCFTAPISALLILDRHDPYLQFEFNLETSVRLICDRCAAPFEYPLSVKAPMLYVIGRVPQELPDDPEIAYLPLGAVDVDITTDLRDFLMLAIPSRSLCSDNCRGLCPKCGADLNEQDCPCGSS